jgi:hypothetical protein
MATGMMGNPFLGLLNQGLSPEQAQAEVDRQRALQFASLNPQTQLAAGIYQGITGLGRALGARDPMLEQASQLRNLASQFETGTSEGMAQYAKAIKDINPEASRQATIVARELLQKEENILKTRAETASKLREQDPKTLFIRANADKFTPASIQAYANTGEYSSLVPFTKESETTKPPADFLAKAVELGFGEKKKIGEYTAEQVKAINSALYDQKVKLAKESKTTISVDTKGPTKFEEELGKLDAKKVTDAVAQREGAISALRSLDEMSKLSNEGLISGTFATGRVGATNLLDTLGLLGSGDKEKLARSENYAKVSGDVVLGTLGGKLGAGFSNEDRKFIQGLVPQLENSPLARRQLIEFMQKKFTDIANEATRLEDYARENRSLKGFKPKIPLPGGGGGVSSMSIEDLARAAGGRIVNGQFVPGRN